MISLCLRFLNERLRMVAAPRRTDSGFPTTENQFIKKRIFSLFAKDMYSS